jgi:3-oxoacyl-[acyl-carrier-protein] synthase-1
VSTACSSGARALVSAARLLRAGVLDAVVCGGVDTLSGFTMAGFDALGALAPTRCNPMSRRRAGLHLGEGAALFLLGRDAAAVRLAGWGETSDAHHASAPEPSGRHAADAVRAALARAGVRAEDLDYVNLHGTGTPQNDAMESRAMAEVIGSDVPCSSTKPLTGHVLGGGSAVEAALAWGVVAGAVRKLPVHVWDGEVDPALPRLRLVGADEVPARPPRAALSNAFGFGGSNVALVWRSE